MKKQIILMLIIVNCHNTDAQTNNCYTGKGISTNLLLIQQTQKWTYFFQIK
jgi:hypothetical protein